jgi:hypothetical protein
MGILRRMGWQLQALLEWLVIPLSVWQTLGFPSKAASKITKTHSVCFMVAASLSALRSNSFRSQAVGASPLATLGDSYRASALKPKNLKSVL